MKLSPDQIAAQLAESLSAPLPEADFAELLVRLASLEGQVELLRSSPLLAEEAPSLPPSLEERP